MNAPETQLNDVLHDLGRSIEALADRTDAIVLIGGLAVYLYRWYIPTAPINQPPLLTFDIDWAVSERLPPPHEISIHSKLKDAGFVASLSGSQTLPVTRYYLEHRGRNYQAPIYLEFIAPRKGSKTSRQGQNQGIIEVEPGLYAQTDPYLPLLLVENFTVDTSLIPALGTSQGRTIHLPHPACFVVQKALIRHRRESHKRDNDAAHIFDIALTTRQVWRELGDSLARIERGPEFSPNWFTKARKILARVFAAPEAAGPVGVARVYRNALGESAAPSEPAIHRAVAGFLKSLRLSTE